MYLGIRDGSGCTLRLDPLDSLGFASASIPWGFRLCDWGATRFISHRPLRRWASHPSAFGYEGDTRGAPPQPTRTSKNSITKQAVVRERAEAAAGKQKHEGTQRLLERSTGRVMHRWCPAADHTLAAHVTCGRDSYWTWFAAVTMCFHERRSLGRAHTVKDCLTVAEEICSTYLPYRGHV